MNREKQTQRKGLKSGLSAEEHRRKREDSMNEIRKSKNSEALQKKRMMNVSSTTSVDSPTSIQQIYIDQVNSNEEAQQLEGTIAFRKLLSMEKNPPIDGVIQSGVVPRFVQFLTHSVNTKLRFESAWAITNIASGNTVQTEYVVKLGVVPIFVHLLADGDEEIREQATWALGNIAGDSVAYRNYTLDSNIVAPLVHILQVGSQKMSVIRNATWTISNLCRGKPTAKFEVIAPFAPVLGRLIHHHDLEVIIDATWALSYISDGTDSNIQAVIDSNVVPRLIQLLEQHFPHNVQTPALRTLGNIVTGNDQQTSYCLEKGILPALKPLLGSSKKNIRKEAAWTISNITAGTKEQAQQVIDSDYILPKLIELMGANSDFDVRKEAAYAISNATTWKNYKQCQKLMQLGVADKLSDLLIAKDNKIILIALEAIDNILSSEASFSKDGSAAQFAATFEEKDVIDRLEALQDHETEDIYVKALKILEQHFGASDEDENLAPSVNAATGTFNFQAPKQNTHTTFNF